MLRGRKRELDTAHKVEASLSASIHNRFDVEVIDARTGEVRQRAQAENVICEQLWTRLLTPASYFEYIQYGSGSGTPAATDTSLFHYEGYLKPGSYTMDIAAADAAAGVVYRRRKVQLLESQAVGITITEVGIAYGASSGNLVTHAMLQDMNGGPISIEKADTDIINVFATVYVHWDPSGYDKIGVLPYVDIWNDYYPIVGFVGYLLGGYLDSHDYLNACPPLYVQATSGCVYTGATEQQYTTVRATYDISSKTISLTSKRFGIADANIGGIIGFIFWNGIKNKSATRRTLCYPAVFMECGANWFRQSDIVGEAIGTGDGHTTDFKTVFPLPENATVYVNGIAQQDVIVDKTVLTNDLGASMIGIDSQSTLNNIIPYPQPELKNSSSFQFFGEAFYYNPYYASVGIDEVAISEYTLYASSDNFSWVPIVTKGQATVPTKYRNYPFWRVEGEYSKYGYLKTNDITGYNIHFTTPPPAGAVITADYTTKCIAKDENHVFDLTVTIHLGEYNT